MAVRVELEKGPAHCGPAGSSWRAGFWPHRWRRAHLQNVRGRLQKRTESLDPSDPEYYEKLNELRAMDIAADALLIYAQRYAEKLEKMAEGESDPARKEELRQKLAR